MTVFVEVVKNQIAALKTIFCHVVYRNYRKKSFKLSQFLRTKGVQWRKSSVQYYWASTVLRLTASVV